MRTILAISLLVLTATLLLTPTAAGTEQNPYDVLEHVYEKIYKLNHSHIDTSRLVSMVNEKLLEWENGTISTKEFTDFLEAVEHNITLLEEKSGEATSYYYGLKLSAAMGFAVLTPIFYYLFPRIYLWIWYRLYKRWVIEE